MHNITGAIVLPGRARQSDRVHTKMPVVALILCRDHGLRHITWQVRCHDHSAAHIAAMAQCLAVICQNGHGRRMVRAPQTRCIGQLHRIIEKHPADADREPKANHSSPIDHSAQHASGPARTRTRGWLPTSASMSAASAPITSTLISASSAAAFGTASRRLTSFALIQFRFYALVTRSTIIALPALATCRSFLTVAIQLVIFLIGRQRWYRTCCSVRPQDHALGCFFLIFRFLIFSRTHRTLASARSRKPGSRHLVGWAYIW